MRIIISAELATRNDAANIKATIALRDILELHGVSYTPVQGMYKGTKEYSVMVQGDSNTLDLIRTLGRLFNQESILVLSDDNRANLHYLHGANKTVHIGTFQQVKSIVGLDAYTWIDGKFYTCA